MKNLLFVFALLMTFSFVASAQMPALPKPDRVADPADVGSLDAIINAVYASISGDAGKARDWDRFRSLFYKGARLIPSGKNAKTGVTGANIFTPDEYIKQAEPYFAKEGFYETEKARRVEIYGNIAHAFSTYESRHAPNEKTPFMRGINSIQLLNDGTRWWIITIY